jgi:CheY-like chemotaxis protein
MNGSIESFGGYPTDRAVAGGDNDNADENPILNLLRAKAIMTKHVLDVGNCAMDHSSIRSMLEGQFSVQVTQAHGWADASEHLQRQPFDLVLVNRILDRDGSEGLEIIRQMKSEIDWKDTPVMLITNFSEHQERAVMAGALQGFGKRAIGDPQTVDMLRPILD